MAFHANGDAAIEYVTRGFEEALAACPRKVPGHMIIHTQMASDDQLARLHACGVTPTFFVRHVNVWGERHVNIFLGEERAARLDPCGSCVRLGIPFALHVDSPVQPVDAIRSIHTAVNRTTSAGRVLGPDQRVSTLHALGPIPPTPPAAPRFRAGLAASPRAFSRISSSFPPTRWPHRPKPSKSSPSCAPSAADASFTKPDPHSSWARPFRARPGRAAAPGTPIVPGGALVSTLEKARGGVLRPYNRRKR